MLSKHLQTTLEWGLYLKTELLESILFFSGSISFTFKFYFYLFTNDEKMMKNIQKKGSRWNCFIFKRISKNNGCTGLNNNNSLILTGLVESWKRTNSMNTNQKVNLSSWLCGIFDTHNNKRSRILRKLSNLAPLNYTKLSFWSKKWGKKENHFTVLAQIASVKSRLLSFSLEFSFFLSFLSPFCLTLLTS